jgi:RNA polymerase-binding transcription factor
MAKTKKKKAVKKPLKKKRAIKKPIKKAKKTVKKVKTLKKKAVKIKKAVSKKAKPVKKAAKKVKAAKKSVVKKAKKTVKAIKKATAPKKSKIKKAVEVVKKKILKARATKKVAKVTKKAIKGINDRIAQLQMELKPGSKAEIDKQIKKIREELLSMKADALKRIQTKKDVDMPEAEVGDPIDQASQSLDKELLFEINDSTQKTLEQIESALRKIEIGTFGVCESCRATIPLKRLQAIPFARYCVHCQASNEN